MNELTVTIITATLPWEVSRKSIEVESQAGGFVLSSTLPGGVILGKSLSLSDCHPWGGGGDTHGPVCSRTLSRHRINVNLTVSLGTVSSSSLGCLQYFWCKVNSYKVSSVLCHFSLFLHYGNAYFSYTSPVPRGEHHPSPSGAHRSVFQQMGIREMPPELRPPSASHLCR